MATSLPEELHFPKLEFNEGQQRILESLGYQLTERLMQLSFADPTQDQRNIRYHASLTGKLEAVHELLGYDAKVAERQEEALRERAFEEPGSGNNA